MANFETAFNWMMDNEDRTRAHAIVPDVGGHAVSGINSASFPEAFSAISALPQAERGLAVQNFYQVTFWNQSLGALATDEVAKRVFDAAVNMGAGTAVKLLQRAANTLNSDMEQIATDGTWGPATVTAANTPHSDSMVVAFIQARRRHYQAIVAVRPELSKYLDAWLARAGK